MQLVSVFFYSFSKFYNYIIVIVIKRERKSIINIKQYNFNYLVYYKIYD